MAGILGAGSWKQDDWKLKAGGSGNESVGAGSLRLEAGAGSWSLDAGLSTT